MTRWHDVLAVAHRTHPAYRPREPRPDGVGVALRTHPAYRRPTSALVGVGLSEADLTEAIEPTEASDTQAELPEAEVLRRRLRIALTKARHEAQLTPRAVAEALDWSASKLARIEQGLVPVAPSDVRVMLGEYGVDTARVGELVQLARQAREAASWNEYNSVLSPTFKEMIGQEGSARSIWKYEPSVVPGYFQTAGYSQALFMALGETPEDAALLAEVRAKRQEILEPDFSGPDVHVVIGEAALIRPVGGDEIMREQIIYLIELNRRSKIHLYFLAFSAGSHPAMGQAFTVLQVDDPDLYDSLYLEDGEMRITSVDDRDSVVSHLATYNQLQGLAEQAGSFEEHGLRILEELYL